MSLKTHVSNRPVLPSWAIALTPIGVITQQCKNPIT